MTSEELREMRNNINEAYRTTIDTFSSAIELERNRTAAPMAPTPDYSRPSDMMSAMVDAELRERPTDRVREIPTDAQPMTQLTPEPIREVRIQSLSAGFVITVGCQGFAVSTPQEVGALVAAYLTRPAELEKEFFSEKGHYPGRAIVDSIFGKRATAAETLAKMTL